MKKRLLIKITRETLPQVKERYPFIYLEHGRLEVDDSSVKWIDSECNVVRIPSAMVLTLLLGPGTAVTHEAMKVLGDSNVTVCWVGTDSLLYYAQGKSPNADTRQLRKQVSIAMDAENALVVARRMFASRFPNQDISTKSIHELMGMEGIRVRALYETLAQKYQVGWIGRSYVPGKFEMSDVTNKILTANNTALYSLILSELHALGYSPYVGFVHTGSPLPFVYDLADLYKAEISIDLAFALTKELGGEYDRNEVVDAFVERVINTHMLERMPIDIENLFKGMKDAGGRCR